MSLDVKLAEQLRRDHSINNHTIRQRHACFMVFYDDNMTYFDLSYFDQVIIADASVDTHEVSDLPDF